MRSRKPALLEDDMYFMADGRQATTGVHHCVFLQLPAEMANIVSRRQTMQQFMRAAILDTLVQ
jgi:hypothetical protein